MPRACSPGSAATARCTCASTRPLRTDVRAWVRAEQECCAFLSFELDRDGRELRLAVAGPKGSEPVLDGLLAALRGETS